MEDICDIKNKYLNTLYHLHTSSVEIKPFDTHQRALARIKPII